MMPDDFSDVFRDRQGRPCGMDRYVEIAGDEYLRVIGADIVPSSQGWVVVTTIWTGVDMSPLSPRSLIFETLVRDRRMAHLDTWRYGTLPQATIGHQRMIERFAQPWWTNLGGLA